MDTERVLRPVHDLSGADWLLARGSVSQVMDFGPPGFEAYARLRFIPDPAHDGQAEADVDLPADRPSDIALSRRALLALGAHTSTASSCWFGLWVGHAGLHLPGGSASGPLLTLPDREYVMMRGPLEAIEVWEHELGHGQPISPPSLVWPDDHAWFFACDVDPHWAGIGAADAAVRVLLDDPDLDVVRCSPKDAQPYYR